MGKTLLAKMVAAEMKQTFIGSIESAKEKVISTEDGERINTSLLGDLYNITRTFKYETAYNTIYIGAGGHGIKRSDLWPLSQILGLDTPHVPTVELAGFILHMLKYGGNSRYFRNLEKDSLWRTSNLRQLLTEEHVKFLSRLKGIKRLRREFESRNHPIGIEALLLAKAAGPEEFMKLIMCREESLKVASNGVIILIDEIQNVPKNTPGNRGNRFGHLKKADISVSPATVIGTTTNPKRLHSRVRDEFTISLQMDNYDTSDMLEIGERVILNREYSVSHMNVLDRLVSHSRYNPGEMAKLVDYCIDVSTATSSSKVIDDKVVDTTLVSLGIRDIDTSHGSERGIGGQPSFDDVDEMNGQQFESFAASILKAMGFTNVETTPISGDYGADLICNKGEIRYAVQCKRYALNKKVPVNAVQEAITAKEYYGCNEAMVVTTSYLTAPARQLANKVGCIIFDRDMLKTLYKLL